jgi:hypothetical protein
MRSQKFVVTFLIDGARRYLTATGDTTRVADARQYTERTANDVAWQFREDNHGVVEAVDLMAVPVAAKRNGYTKAQLAMYAAARAADGALSSAEFEYHTARDAALSHPDDRARVVAYAHAEDAVAHARAVSNAAHAAVNNIPANVHAAAKATAADAGRHAMIARLASTRPKRNAGPAEYVVATQWKDRAAPRYVAPIGETLRVREARRYSLADANAEARHFSERYPRFLSSVQVIPLAAALDIAAPTRKRPRKVR